MDQGCQFTGQEFTGLLRGHGIKISVDNRGSWWDNVLVERLRRNLSYEEVYLRAYETVSAVNEGVARYLTFYNQQRSHCALDGHTPDRAYWGNRPTQPAAA